MVGSAPRLLDAASGPVSRASAQTSKMVAVAGHLEATPQGWVVGGLACVTPGQRGSARAAIRGEMSMAVTCTSDG